MNIQKVKKQYGGVSLFVVVFAAILFSVIVLSFVSVMTKELQRSSDNELAQSAYDSARSGIEDAKRVLVRCLQEPASSACAAIDARECDTVARAQIANTNRRDEVPIKNGSSVNNGVDVNQAYTCLKMSRDTPDFLGSTSSHDGMLSVPLKAAANFNKVRIEWQRQGSGSDAVSFNNSASCSTNTANDLCVRSSWGNMPALMRAQFILPDSSFTLSSLNDPAVNNSYMLRPIGLAGSVSSITGGANSVARDTINSTTSKTVYGVNCDINRTYICAVDISLPKAVSVDSSVSLLRLKSMYRGADIRVTLYDNTTPVDFRDVQVGVDVTGRTSDIFRRLDARLIRRNADKLTMPEYAVDLDGGLCKNFSVIDIVGDGYPTSSGSCTP